MIHLIAAFFTFLFSFGHAQNVQQAQMHPYAETGYAGAITNPVPSYEQMRTGNFQASYAGGACACVTRTDVVFIER